MADSGLSPPDADGQMDIEADNSTVLELRVTAVHSACAARIDRWLAEHVSDLSRSRIQKLIEQRAVFVNDAPCTNKKSALQSGDHIRIELPAPVPLDIVPEPIPLDILYEDDALIIINKPAGLVVHPAPGHPSGTLVNAMLYHCGATLTGVGGVSRPGIVHRLDKDTTGAMVVAKT